MRLGVFCGGGGLVGIAWEVGVLAGIEKAAGLRLADAEVVVGTSAGSVAGAHIALGHDLAAIAERHRRGGEKASASPSVDRPPAPDLSAVPRELWDLLLSSEGAAEERGRKLGQLAMGITTAQSEDDYIESFRRMLDTDEWPSLDYRATAVECETGATKLWQRSDGVGLLRAVASSCAIPGLFPTVSINGRHYTDGPRARFTRAVADEKALDAVLFVGPLAALPEGVGADPDLDALERDGIPVARVTGSDEFAVLTKNLMDPAARAKAVEIGYAEGRAAAAAVSALNA